MGQAFLSSTGEIVTDQAGSVSTTDATVTTLATASIASGTVNYMEATVLAKDANGDGAVYKLSAHIKDVASTTTLQNVTVLYSDEDVSAMDATIDVSGNDVRIRVTGQASVAVDWTVTYRLESIT